MDTFKKRLPQKQQMLYVFLAFAFASNAWTLYDITQEFPALILRLSIGELVGVVSHSLVFALVDGLFAFAALLILAMLLPSSWLRDRFMPVGTAVAFLTAVWMGFFHLNNLLGQRDIPILALWLGSYLLILGSTYFMIYKNEKVHKGIVTFIERLALLAGIYLILDLLGVIVIIIRNIGGVA